MFFFTSTFFLSTNNVVVFVVCFWSLILVAVNQDSNEGRGREGVSNCEPGEG